MKNWQFPILTPMLTSSFCFFLAGAMLMPSAAHAYVDPGSGSVIVTTLLGIVAAISYTFRKFFYNVKQKLFGKSSAKSDTDRPADD